MLELDTCCCRSVPLRTIDFCRCRLTLSFPESAWRELPAHARHVCCMTRTRKNPTLGSLDHSLDLLRCRANQTSCILYYRIRHVPLVSHKFNEACQDPFLWSELHVKRADFPTEARWQSFLLWLAARAPRLRSLVFDGNYNKVEAFICCRPVITTRV